MIRSTTLLALCILVMPVCVADALKGRVRLTGSIVESACNIIMNNGNQTITLTPQSLNSLVASDTSTPKTLSIHIQKCFIMGAPKKAPPQWLRLTLEGQPEGKYFAVKGAARGIGLRIVDEEGRLVSPGMIIDHRMGSMDDLILNYSLTLVGSGHALEAGDYHATIRLSIQHF